MNLITNENTLRNSLKEARISQKSIGFVPTMGYLHEGHLSLIRQAKKENEIVVVSIFVNPTQFGPNEDFEKYPRNIERDYQMATGAGADLIFYPEVQEIYPVGTSTFVEVEGEMTKKLCGMSRPTHFKGVTTVVSILLNIVMPEKAYFGQKDAQQALVIQKMVRDLHMQAEIIVCPIVREEDGLAMSSRNVYLSVEERQQAVVLSAALKHALNLFRQGERCKTEIIQLVRGMIEEMPLAKIDYIEMFETKELNEVDIINTPVLLAVAVFFGKTRLIDNVILNPLV